MNELRFKIIIIKKSLNNDSYCSPRHCEVRGGFFMETKTLIFKIIMKKNKQNDAQRAGRRLRKAVDDAPPSHIGRTLHKLLPEVATDD